MAWIGVSEASKRLGCSRQTVYRLVRADQIGHRKIGERNRIEVREADVAAREAGSSSAVREAFDALGASIARLGSLLGVSS